MSTKDNSEFTQEQLDAEPVAKGELRVILDDLGKTMSESLNKAIESMETIVSNKINANTAEISRTLNEHANAIQSIAAAIQAPQPQTQAQGIKQLIAEVLQSPDLRPIILQKIGVNPVDPVSEGFGDLAQTLALGAKREVQAAMKLSIRKYLKQGHLFTDEVKDVIVDKAATSHGI